MHTAHIILGYIYPLARFVFYHQPILVAISKNPGSLTSQNSIKLHYKIVFLRVPIKTPNGIQVTAI